MHVIETSRSHQNRERKLIGIKRMGERRRRHQCAATANCVKQRKTASTNNR